MVGQLVKPQLVGGLGNRINRHLGIFLHNELGALAGCCEVRIPGLHDFERHIESLRVDDFCNTVDMPSWNIVRNNCLPAPIICVRCCTSTIG